MWSMASATQGKKRTLGGGVSAVEYIDSNWTDSINPTVTVPSHNDGDTLIAFLHTDYGGTAVPIPSGWTNIYGQAGTSGYNYIRVCYRIASSEPSSYNFTLGGGLGGAFAGIVSVTNASSFTASSSTARSTAGSCPSVNGVNGNGLIFRSYQAIGTYTGYVSSGHTGLHKYVGSYNRGGCDQYITGPDSGSASGSVSFTNSTSTTYWLGVTVLAEAS